MYVLGLRQEVACSVEDCEARGPERLMSALLHPTLLLVSDSWPGPVV